MLNIPLNWRSSFSSKLGSMTLRNLTQIHRYWVWFIKIWTFTYVNLEITHVFTINDSIIVCIAVNPFSERV